MNNNPLIHYYLLLLKSLTKEIAHLKNKIVNFKYLQKEILTLQSHINKLSGTNLKYNQWVSINAKYKRLVHLKANALNDSSTISATYRSMKEFWTDASLQEKALSTNTFWDTYEHGRRRQLEKCLAKSYGSERALLVNSGMSAITIAFGIAKLKKGDTILLNKKQYFETSKFIKDWIEPLGVKTIRVDFQDFIKVKEGLKKKPKLVFLETITNEPDLSKPEKVELWSKSSKESLFIIDNSIQSFNTKWFSLFGNCKDVLVIESGTKYLTQECMAGVLFGSKNVIEEARDYARDTGQQLQEKAFNFIAEGEIQYIEKKLSIHSNNVTIFSNLVRSKLNNLLDIKTLGVGRMGPIIFIRYKKTYLEPAKLYRKIIERWKSYLAKSNLNIDIRAGFGWNHTSARVYEGSKLNQQDAPSYIRISIGIEPTETIKIFASEFVKVAQEISNK